MKVSIWWNGENALARECNVVKDGDEYWYHGYRVNPEWIHTDPEIPEGTLCYGWSGKGRPEYPITGYFRDGLLDIRSTPEEDNNEWPFKFDHIEPVPLVRLIRWELIPHYYDILYELESTRRYAGHKSDGRSIGDTPFDKGDHIIAIHERPEHE